MWGRVLCTGQDEFRCKCRGFLPFLDMLPAHSNSQKSGPDQRSSAFHSSSESSALSFVPFFNHIFSTMGKLEGGRGGFKGLDGKSCATHTWDFYHTSFSLCGTWEKYHTLLPQPDSSLCLCLWHSQKPNIEAEGPSAWTSTAILMSLLLCISPAVNIHLITQLGQALVRDTQGDTHFSA